MKSSPAKKSPHQKIVIIYHGDCPDGFGGAWAAWKKFGAKAAYLPAKNRDATPCPLKNKEVYLIDYTYTPNIIKQLVKDNIRVTIIDHHATAKASLSLVADSLYALDRSGSVLAWNYFHPGQKTPVLLRYVEDRDIWNWKVPDAREMLMLIDLAPFDFHAWSRMARELEDPRLRAANVKKGALLFVHYKSLYEKLLPSAELVKFAGKKVYLLNCPYFFADDLGHILALRTRSFAVLWSEAGGRIKVSLRSVHGFDVGRIAKKYGGGGHKHSAAFSFEVGKKTPWKLLPEAFSKERAS
jgi:oligoribonuclease NrnB/cAMP/cGMP phosphodiesterase (DHH superfamily)